MAVVSGGSSSESGDKVSFTADIASFRHDEASASLCDDEYDDGADDDVEERSVTIDYYEDPPDETLRIILCDGRTVAIQRQEDANGYGDGDFYIDATRPLAEATHEGFVFGDGNSGSNSASNSDENGSDVKVFKVLVKEDVRDGQRSRQGQYEDGNVQRSSSVVTFSDEQNGGRGGYDFMDEPLLERSGRYPLKSALRQSTTADGSALSSSAHVPPNPGASPRQQQPGDATDGDADLIFDYVEGDKRRERRRLNSARSKNRLLRKHCSNKDSSVCSAGHVANFGSAGRDRGRDIKRGAE